MSAKTKLKSTLMGVMSSGRYASWGRSKARYLRKLRADSPSVDYFHQVDDPYSHLVVQKLDALRESYSVDFVVHLVSAPEPDYKGDAGKFDRWARADAASIADYFSVEFAPTVTPTIKQVASAQSSLQSFTDSHEFANKAVEVGNALWRGELEPSPKTVRTRHGDQLRKRLGHYLSGTFYFEGEWYWGLDRLHLLEARLQKEGFGGGSFVCPLPKQEAFHVAQAGPGIELDYFPSLRSPYSAIGHQRVLDLIESSKVKLNLRPVMPMMMRGVKAPIAKQRYIMSDSGREARHYRVPFGPFCDPFGEPVKRAFEAYHQAEKQGLGLTFVTKYLKAAWSEGLDITVPAGLEMVCQRAGLSYASVDPRQDWQAALEENVQLMAQYNLWGVPSFRVSGGSNSEPYACWGQDRVWRVAAEIEKRR